MPANRARKSYIHEQASALFGIGSERIGKTQARQEFLPLVDHLGANPRAIEITDRDTPVAVLLAYGHYAALVSQLSKLSRKKPRNNADLMGSVIIQGDLDAASREIASDFNTSIKRSAASL